MRIAIYADGAKAEDMVRQYRDGTVKGFTTNPTLMAKAGVRDYQAFAKSLLKEIRDLPISFEVFADEFEEMERQAKLIGTWGSNVYIKIPITNTKSESALPLIRRLFDAGLKLNITAIFTDEQIDGLAKILKPKDDAIVSIFAGRIADAGVDPVPIMARAVKVYKDFPKAQILWASPREVLNVYQAEECGCHIITVTDDILKKLPLKGKSLKEFSLETVKMFYADATKAGFDL
jgi:transaldolase